jgi:hypothetical protein
MGVCNGTPKTCPAPDACHVGLCDEAQKACSSMVGNDGAACMQSDKCFSSGVCAGGTCLGTAPVDCTFLNGPCSQGQCDPALGCQAVPANNGASCDDGLFCTVNDTCNGGACSGTPMTCPPLMSQCQVNVCSEALKGCVAAASSDGTSCSTNNPCLSGATCTAGACGGGVPANQGMPCMGVGGPCVTNFQCNAGTCAGTPITVCGGGDGCCPAGCTPANDPDCNCTVNLALSAVGSVSPGGGMTPPYTPAELNNGIGKSQCNRWSWVTNSSTPSGAWFELDWLSPVTVASIYVETTDVNGQDPTCPGSPGRNVAGGNVQAYNGSTWVTVATFANQTNDFQLDVQPPVTTSKLRLYDVVTGNNGSNSLIFEWHVFGAPGCIPPPD